jgi:hypothetical protein
VGRRISDVSEDIYAKLIEQLKTSHFALQVDETTGVIKDIFNYLCLVCVGILGVSAGKA